MWVWTALRVKDHPLTLLEGVAFTMYGSGLIYALFLQNPL